jgi:hypothetical protein
MDWDAVCQSVILVHPSKILSLAQPSPLYFASQYTQPIHTIPTHRQIISQNPHSDRTYPSYQRKQDAYPIHEVDMQVKQDHSKSYGHNLFTANTQISTGETVWGMTHFALTVMVKAPAFLFAVNETMFRPQAITPLINNAIALFPVICVAP